MSKCLAILGLSLTLLGAGLLFIYGYPTKTIGNRKLFGELSVSFSEDGVHKHDPNWQRKADSFQKRAKWLNRGGFALIALGTLFQGCAVVVQD